MADAHTWAKVIIADKALLPEAEPLLVQLHALGAAEAVAEFEELVNRELSWDEKDDLGKWEERGPEERIWHRNVLRARQWEVSTPADRRRLVAVWRTIVWQCRDTTRWAASSSLSTAHKSAHVDQYRIGGWTAGEMRVLLALTPQSDEWLVPPALLDTLGDAEAEKLRGDAVTATAAWLLRGFGQHHPGRRWSQDRWLRGSTYALRLLDRAGAALAELDGAVRQTVAELLHPDRVDEHRTDALFAFELLDQLGTPPDAAQVLRLVPPLLDHLRRHAPDVLQKPGLANLLRAVHGVDGPRRAELREMTTLLEAVPDGLAAVRALLDGPIEATTHGKILLRGLLWLLTALPVGASPWAEQRFARSADVALLAARGTDPAMRALMRQHALARTKTERREVQRAVERVAQSRSLRFDDVVERFAPDFGLDAAGERRETLTGGTAVLRATGEGTAELSYRNPAGKPLKNPPKALRAAHPERIRELKDDAKELQRALDDSVARLEALLSTGATRPAPVWREHLLGQPLSGVHARRLIWEVRAGDTWLAGLPEADGEHWRLLASDGTPVWHSAKSERAEQAQLRLWHPLRAEVEQVRAWRDHLTAAKVTQPFDQAFRSIYLLTPAEEDTGSYSNRFAAHILKYSAAKARLAAQGWAPLRHHDDAGAFREHKRTRRTLHDAATGTAWTAEFFVQIVEAVDAGGYACCASDQVRFYAGRDTEPTPLGTVPALVFSEVMRDIDLAVGESSIAGDPEWADSGPDRHRIYWRRTMVAELTETGAMRRAALERLIPGLAIADRLTLTDRYLVVRGDRRTYKIHLGSASILMEPNDAYLCIQPASRPGDRLFLPFEQDGGRLAVILSKALLLANDTAITDQTVTRQIGAS